MTAALLESPASAEKVSAFIVPDDNDRRCRFKVGDYAYVRGHRSQSVVIAKKLLHIAPFKYATLSLPHYLVVDANGQEWQVSQLELTTRSFYE